MTPRDRRALLFGGSALLLMFLLLRALPWGWRSLSALHSRLAAEREYVVRGRRELERLPVLADSTRILTARVLELAPRLLGASSATEASAVLQGHLSTLALQHHARFDKGEPVPDSATAGSLRRSTLGATVETDVRGLAALLSALGGSQLVTEITRLRVSGPDPSIEGPGPEVLRIELRVRAWYLVEEAS